MKATDFPKIYKRCIDHHWTAVVRLHSGRSCRRGTRCKDKFAAEHFARLLQLHVDRRAAAGDLLPPAK